MLMSIFLQGAAFGLKRGLVNTVFVIPLSSGSVMIYKQLTHVDEARVVVESAQVRPRERQEGVEPRREVLRKSSG